MVTNHIYCCEVKLADSFHVALAQLHRKLQHDALMPDRVTQFDESASRLQKWFPRLPVDDWWERHGGDLTSLSLLMAFLVALLSIPFGIPNFPRVEAFCNTVISTFIGIGRLPLNACLNAFESHLPCERPIVFGRTYGSYLCGVVLVVDSVVFALLLLSVFILLAALPVGLLYGLGTALERLLLARQQPVGGVVFVCVPEGQGRGGSGSGRLRIRIISSGYLPGERSATCACGVC